MRTKGYLLSLLLLAVSSSSYATITVPIYATLDGKQLGEITVTDSSKGLILTPNLRDLPPGPHGFHIHEKGFCSHHGDDAGGHYDPLSEGKHRGPYDKHGHLGDLPILEVAKDGSATATITAPRLTLKDIQGRSFMIHAGGDNYSDQPKMGGGGSRIACGVIPREQNEEKPSRE